MSTTPYRGFGLAPFGLSPYGYGSPALANPNIGLIFKKQDNSIGSSRLIDPATRDYKVDPTTGRMLGMDDMQQMVYLALVTVKGSSTVALLGQSFTSIKIITQNIEAQIDNEVRRALEKLTQKKLITIDNVFVEVDEHNVARIHVVWTDTSKNVQVTTSI